MVISSPGFIGRSAVSIAEKEEASQNHLALGPQLVNIRNEQRSGGKYDIDEPMIAPAQFEEDGPVVRKPGMRNR